MKLEDFIKELKKHNKNKNILIHDNHQIHRILEIREDSVLGEECVAIVINRF